MSTPPLSITSLAQAQARIKELENLVEKFTTKQESPFDKNQTIDVKLQQKFQNSSKPRLMVPAGSVDHSIDRDPACCRHCCRSLKNERRLEAQFREITDLPYIRAMVLEYRLWRKRCPQCGHFSRGTMPSGSPSGNLGPRLQGLATALAGMFHLSQETAIDLLSGGIQGVGARQQTGLPPIPRGPAQGRVQHPAGRGAPGRVAEGQSRRAGADPG